MFFYFPHFRLRFVLRELPCSLFLLNARGVWRQPQELTPPCAETSIRVHFATLPHTERRYSFILNFRSPTSRHHTSLRDNFWCRPTRLINSMNGARRRAGLNFFPSYLELRSSYAAREWSRREYWGGVEATNDARPRCRRRRADRPVGVVFPTAPNAAWCFAVAVDSPASNSWLLFSPSCAATLPAAAHGRSVSCRCAVEDRAATSWPSREPFGFDWWRSEISDNLARTRR